MIKESDDFFKLFMKRNTRSLSGWEGRFTPAQVGEALSLWTKIHPKTLTPDSTWGKKYLT